MEKNTRRINLEDLGYNEFFRSKKTGIGDSDLVPARIIAAHKGFYILRNEFSRYIAQITGRMMFDATSKENYPAIGDWVLVTVLSKDQAVIRETLPRRTVLKRKLTGRTDPQVIAANIDVAFIVQSPDRDYSLNRFERYSSLAESGKIKPAFILNKADLLDEAELEERASRIKDRFSSTDIHMTSAFTGRGLVELKKDIRKGLTYCFIGSSGVGKSSIINMLLGEDVMKTGEISARADRGKHITTHRELFVLDNGGLLIDNPGMREVGLIDSDAETQSIFSEVQLLAEKCRFSDCRHLSEPGCAVLEAVMSGNFDKEKYENYIKLVKENEINKMTATLKQEKDRKSGKLARQSKKTSKKNR